VTETKKTVQTLYELSRQEKTALREELFPSSEVRSKNAVLQFFIGINEKTDNPWMLFFMIIMIPVVILAVLVMLILLLCGVRGFLIVLIGLGIINSLIWITDVMYADIPIPAILILSGGYLIFMIVNCCLSCSAHYPSYPSAVKAALLAATISPFVSFFIGSLIGSHFKDEDRFSKTAIIASLLFVTAAAFSGYVIGLICLFLLCLISAAGLIQMIFEMIT